MAGQPSSARTDLPSDVQRRRQHLLEVLGTVTTRTIQLVESLPEEAANRPASGGDWTVAEVAAHLVTIARRATEDYRRSSTAQGTAVLNRQVLDEYGERRLSRIAADLPVAVTAMQERLALAVQLIPTDRLVPFHAGMRIPIEQAIGVAIGEFLVHGSDIASGVGLPVECPEDEAALVLRTMAPVLRGWTAPHPTPGQFGLQLSDGGTPLAFTFAISGLRVDSVTSPQMLMSEPIAPSDVLLALYGRTPPSHPIVHEVVARLLPI